MSKLQGPLQAAIAKAEKKAPWPDVRIVRHKLLDALTEEPLPADEIARKAGTDVTKTSRALSDAARAGKISRVHYIQGRYSWAYCKKREGENLPPRRESSSISATLSINLTLKEHTFTLTPSELTLLISQLTQLQESLK